MAYKAKNAKYVCYSTKRWTAFALNKLMNKKVREHILLISEFKWGLLPQILQTLKGYMGIFKPVPSP